MSKELVAALLESIKNFSLEETFVYLAEYKEGFSTSWSRRPSNYILIANSGAGVQLFTLDGRLFSNV
jgi:hypothetical protein